MSKATLFVCLAFVGTMMAQERPRIVFPGDPVRYTVSIVTPQKPDANPAATQAIKSVTSMDVLRHGKVQCVTYAWSDNTRTQEWIYDSQVMVEEPEGKYIHTYGIDALDIVRNDLAGMASKTLFGWASPSSFVEKSQFNGKPANLFVDAANGIKAWADPVTSVPVAFEKDKVLFAFEFQPSPSGAPSLPEKFAKIIRDQEAERLASQPITSRSNPRP